MLEPGSEAGRAARQALAAAPVPSRAPRPRLPGARGSATRVLQ